MARRMHRRLLRSAGLPRTLQEVTMTSVAGIPRSCELPAATERPDRLRRVLLVCGILSSLVYVTLNVLGTLRWASYSSISQTISELSAIGAPSRSVVVPLGIAYDLLLIAFGVGAWGCAGPRRALRATAALLVAIGAIGPLWPPMHMRGNVPTLTDTMHIVFTAVTSLFILLAVALSATAFGARFRLYAIATLVLLVAFGVLTSLQAPGIPKQQPTPSIGVFERLNLCSYLSWVAALAVTLLRDQPSRGNSARLRRIG
jgi:hypothetical protein